MIIFKLSLVLGIHSIASLKISLFQFSLGILQCFFGLDDCVESDSNIILSTGYHIGSTFEPKTRRVDCSLSSYEVVVSFLEFVRQIVENILYFFELIIGRF